MKNLRILVVLATSVATASAQTPASRGGSGSAAQRASTSNADAPPAKAATVTSNYKPGNGQRAGGKINTAPATGATRASRSSSSSTAKAARQGSATGSGKSEMMSKNSHATLGAKK